MTTVETFFNQFGNKEKSHKLQARLTSTLREHQEAQFKCAAGREDIARMECRANKASALVWRAFPLTTDFRLTDEETSFAVAYATGLIPPYMPDQCSCKEGQPLTLEHSVHCLEKLTRHNMIQGRLVSFAREHGVATEQNTRLTFEDCKERKEPDIVFYPGNCPAIQTDVTPAPKLAQPQLRIAQLGDHDGHGQKNQEVPRQRPCYETLVHSARVRDARQDGSRSQESPPSLRSPHVRFQRHVRLRHANGSGSHTRAREHSCSNEDNCASTESERHRQRSPTRSA